MKQFFYEYDANRQNSGFYQQSDTIYNVVLQANVMQTINPPTGAMMVLFNSDKVFYCKFNANAVVPAGNVVDGSASEISPDKRSLRNVTDIRLIAAAETVVTLAFYSVPRQAGVDSGFPYVG
jgi:hypothetical protein